MSKKISFGFSGWVRVYADNVVLESLSGKPVDAASLTAEELQNKLNNGELLISLSECLAQSHKSDAETTDFEVEEV